MLFYHINLILFLVSLFILIFFSYNPRGIYYLVFKTITSLLFISVGIISYLQTLGNFYYFLLIITGLIVSLLGDFFLALNKVKESKDKSSNKIFIYGFISFSLTHIMYVLAFIHIGYFKNTDLNVALILALLTMIVLNSNKNIDFNIMFKPACIYSFLIYLMFYEAVKLALSYSSQFASFLLISGSLLFLISDLVLSLIMFHKHPNKILKGINLSTYYIGQFFIASTLLFII